MSDPSGNFQADEKIRSYGLLALIILAAICIRAYFFVGLNWADDPGYVGEAYRVLTGDFHPDNNLNRRIVTYLPIALFFSLFGIHEFSAALFSLICSVGEIILLFVIGKRFLNETIGLLSAALLAVYPLDASYASMAMGDVPISFFSALSIFLFLTARSTGSKRLLVLAGLMAYFSYLIKELALLILVFMFLITAFDTLKGRAFRVASCLPFIGFLSGWALEGGIYAVFFDLDPFVSLNQGLGYYLEDENRRGLSFNFLYYPNLMFNADAIFSMRPRTNLGCYFYNYFGPFFYLVLFGILYLLIKKKKETWIFIAWLSIFFLWMQFGTMSYKDYIPMHRLDRHLTIITLPALLIFSAFFYYFFCSAGQAIFPGQKVKKTMGIIMVLLLALFWLANLHTITRYQRGTTAYIRALYEQVSLLGKPVYTSEGAIHFMKFLSQFQYEYFRSFKAVRCHDLPGSYIIVDAEIGWLFFDGHKQDLPQCPASPQETWRLIREIEPPFLEAPFDRLRPKIYYVPERPARS